jgi:hypothetical protein
MEDIERLTSEIELLWADQVQEQERSRGQGSQQVESEKSVDKSEPSTGRDDDDHVGCNDGRDRRDREDVQSTAKRKGGIGANKWENRGGITREWITTVSQGSERGNPIHICEIKWEGEEKTKRLISPKTFRARPLPANTSEPHYAQLTAARVTNIFPQVC